MAATEQLQKGPPTSLLTPTLTTSPKEVEGWKLFGINMLSGITSGVANVYVSQPMDTVKVKLHLFPKDYKNWVECLFRVYELEGMKGLYAGTGPALAARLAENTILFAAYDYSKSVVAWARKTEPRHLSIMECGMAGSVAGICSAFTRTPTELVKCRLQTLRELQPEIPRSGAILTKKIAQKEGFSAFYIGLTATLLRQFVGNFFLFATYEGTREMMRKDGERREDVGFVRTMVCGGLGGNAFWLTAFPIDVLKSRIQVRGIKGRGTLSYVLMDLIRKDGYGSLYKGLSASLIRSFISNGVMLLAYEMTKKALLKTV